jgi:hypothetical protein
VSAYEILNAWLRTPGESWRDEADGEMLRDQIKSVQAGDVTLVDAEYVAEYERIVPQEDFDETVKGFYRTMEPVVSPWSRFLFTFRDIERSPYVVYGDYFPHAQFGQHHPLYPDNHALYLAAYYRAGEAGFVQMGSGFLCNWREAHSEETTLSFAHPIREANFIASLHSSLREFPSKEDREALTIIFDIAVRTTVATLAFATARNARMVDVPMTRAERRRGEVPPSIRFSRVTIDPMRALRRPEPRDGGSGEVPWHRVRGHWAIYSAERPMFGRPGLSGRFWISEHERGDKEHGAVVKDYAVLPTREPLP